MKGVPDSYTHVYMYTCTCTHIEILHTAPPSKKEGEFLKLIPFCNGHGIESFLGTEIQEEFKVIIIRKVEMKSKKCRKDLKSIHETLHE